MRSLKTLVFSILVLSFCAFHCQDQIPTTFNAINMTEDTVLIKSEYFPGIKSTLLKPGESHQIHRDLYPVRVVLINDFKVSLFTENGTLLRYWYRYDKPTDIDSALAGCHASYFEKHGVRQLYDETQWTLHDYGETREFIFLILPEDLIPLSEFIDKE